jgi:hypothetical protein
MMDGKSRVVLVDGEDPSKPLDEFAMKAELASLATAGEVEIAAEAPAAANATGTKGAVVFTADAIYVCVDTDTWKKTDLSTWSET